MWVFWSIGFGVKIILTLWYLTLILLAFVNVVLVPGMSSGLGHPVIISIASLFLWLVVYVVVGVYRMMVGRDPLPGTVEEPDQMEPGLETEYLDPGLELAVSQEPFGTGVDQRDKTSNN